MPSLPALIRSLPVASHSERVHRVVTLVRSHADDPRLPVLLNALTGKSDYYALLAVVAARALGDEPRLRALSAHPSRCVRLCAVNSLPLDAGDPEAFAAQYVVCPVGERRRLRRRLIDERHHDLAAALLTAPITDRERASLLVACDSATVTEHLPELGDLVPNLASLVKRHPDVFLAELRRRVTDAPADRRAAAWRWAAPALRRLTHSRPRELALLLAEVERSQGLPEPFYAVAGPLLAAAPGEMVQVLAATVFDDPWDAQRLRRQVGRRLQLLNREQRATILRAERTDDQAMAAYLRALAPSERAQAFADAYEDVELRNREWDGELLDVMPKDLREAEAARMAAMPTNQGWEDQLRLAAHLAPGEALAVAGPFLNSTNSDERGAAWYAILAAALHSREPQAITIAFAHIDDLVTEQDPVRNTAVSALAVASGDIIARIAGERLGKLAAMLAAARDTSPATFAYLRGALWRLVIHRAQQGGDLQEAIALLEALPDPCSATAGRTRIPVPLPIPAAAGKILAAGFLETMKAEADRDEYQLAKGLAALLGPRRYDLPEISGIMRRALKSHDRAMLETAAQIWLGPRRTRGERLGALLRLDPSFVTLRYVQESICRHRPDLAGFLHRKTPVAGRLHGDTPYVALAPGPFTGWLPEQSRPYSLDLARLIADETSSQSRWQRFAAVEVLRRLPWLVPGVLTPGDAEPEIQEAQLVAALRSPAVEWSLTDFLELLDSGLATVAMKAATRVIDELPPVETANALAVVAADTWRKVGIRKLAVRQIARLHCPGAVETLADLALDLSTHRDVRLAATASLVEVLDEERAWEALAEAAAGGRDEALVLARIAPSLMALRHRGRFGEVLVAASPDPELVLALPGWGFWTPKVTSRIVELLDSPEIPVRKAAVEALGGVGSGLRWGLLLVAVAGIAVAAADESDTATEDLAHQRLLEDVISALISGRPRRSMEHRAQLKELARVLAPFPHAAQQHWRVLLAATNWADPLADLAALAEAVSDPLRAHEVLRITWEVVTELQAMKLGADLAVVIDELLGRGDAVGGAVALALLRHAGGESGWGDMWRARLRAARSHPLPAVVAWAREINAAPL